MKKDLSRLQKGISFIFLVGTGITGTLFFVWLTKTLLSLIF